MTKARLTPILLLLASAACSDTADTTPDERPAAAADPAPAPATVQPPSLLCGIDSATVLTPTGIGRLRVGTPVTEARAACRVLRDTTLQLEGTSAPAIVVDLGRDTVVAEVLNDRIWRLRVDGPAFRTSDGLGHGSTIAELREKGSARVARGEGTFILLDEKCGLSFELGGPQIARALPPRISARDLPQDILVVSVLVYGCDLAQSVPESS